MKAAGILFVSLNNTALFLRRTMSAPDCPGCYDFPGGGQEGDETAEQCAIRETREEIGFLPDGERRYLTRTKPATGAQAAVGLGAPAVIPVAAGAPAAPPGVATAQPLIPAPAIALPPVDFTVFVQKVTNEFTPELNDEHDGWAWAPLDAPPEPLHPGCRIALDRLGMNELGVARAIADGRLTSPQYYGDDKAGVMLFAIRITGTDVAYRTKHNEFVHRNPENYLNEEFLTRCNGLPVIWLHPAKSMLNSEEFSERVVGSIFLPYIAGSEVWGIAKIYDDDAAREMEDKQLSTSPAVFFHNVEVNSKLTTDDGRKVLIEGDPSLLDHVAIAPLGVWDKMGPPTGIRSESREDSAMTPEEEKAKKDAEMAADKAKKDAEEAEAAKKKADAEAEEKKKADAAAGTALDKTLAKMDEFCDSMSKRMDSLEASEKERKDAEEKRKADAAAAEDPERLAADKAKKDAEDAKKKADAEAEEEKKKADAAKADSADINKRIDELARKIPASQADSDFHAMVDAQARADEVYSKFGQQAPRPLLGETAPLYRRRIAKDLKQHSQTWKPVDVSGSAFADDAAFTVAETQIYADASRTAMSPATVGAGKLREIRKTVGGHTYVTFVGEPAAWMNRFVGNVQLKGTGQFKMRGLGGN
jgi:8-oxo-dGTP pyrophosphatase MutT (NUDIX family)